MVDQNVIEAFHMMWGPFPEPVLLVHKTREILAANQAALAAGAAVGVKCSSLNLENKTNGHCRHCLALKALRAGTALSRSFVSHERHYKGYWLPLKDVADVYVHFGLNVTAEAESA
jgi:hypothetical protein